DRALKRLSLQRVRDVNLWTVPLVRSGTPMSEVRAQIERSDVKLPLLVDGAGVPRGWLAERALQGDSVPDEPSSDPQPIVELDDVLRDALSDLLAHESMYAPVVDERGAVAGVLSIELLAHLTASEDV